MTIRVVGKERCERRMIVIVRGPELIWRLLLLTHYGSTIRAKLNLPPAGISSTSVLKFSVLTYNIWWFQHLMLPVVLLPYRWLQFPTGGRNGYIVLNLSVRTYYMYL